VSPDLDDIYVQSQLRKSMAVADRSCHRLHIAFNNFQ